VEEKLGAKYVENRQVEFSKSYEESGPETPVFFVLSPGVNPLKDVEALGYKLGFAMDNKYVWFLLLVCCNFTIVYSVQFPERALKETPVVL